VTGTTTIGYTYDGDGYRVRATIDPTDPIAYTWDRTGLGGLGQIITDDTGENVFGPVGLQQRVSGTTPQYAHGDGLGSLRLVTNSTGTALGGATYEPWGTPRSGSVTLGGYGFTGELTDAETGFVYLRARYMDPSTGRFLTEDTYQGTLGSPMSQHRFAYGNDNPVRYTDPSGHLSIPFPSVPWSVANPVAAAAATGLLTILRAAGIAVLSAFSLPVLAAVVAGVGIGLIGGCLIIDACLEYMKWLFGTEQGRMVCVQGMTQVIIDAINLYSNNVDPTKRQQRGAPPPGVNPPGWDSATWKQGDPSRSKDRRTGRTHWYDPDGGEWGYHPDDEGHNPHWDYKPPSSGTGRHDTEWEEIPIDGKPPRKPGYEKK
jgi:RHS repeat-associated protein